MLRGLWSARARSSRVANLRCPRSGGGAIGSEGSCGDHLAQQVVGSASRQDREAVPASVLDHDQPQHVGPLVGSDGGQVPGGVSRDSRVDPQFADRAAG